MSNPALGEAERTELVHQLMMARRKVAEALRAKDEGAEKGARDAVDAVKRELGERGPVWWTDNTPDYNRHLARNTPYAEWFEAESDETDARS